MKRVPWVLCAALGLGLGPAPSSLGQGLDDVLLEVDDLYAETRYYEALDRAAEACDDFPSSAAARSLLGRILFKVARFEEARAVFEEAVALDPYEFWAHYGLGLYHLTDGEPERAIDEFLIARDLWPEHELPHLMLARACETLDRYADAATWMETAIGVIEQSGRDPAPSLGSERDRIAFLADRRPYRVAPGFERTTVAMEAGRPVVTVGLGGQETGRFLLDTVGARAMVAHPDVIRGAPGERMATLDDAGPGIRASRLMLLDRIQIGEMAVEDVPCLVTERFFLGGVDGVIGLPLLRRFAWSFDFERGEVTVRDPRLDTGWESQFGRERVVSKFYPGGPVMVPAVFCEERPAVLILDTGSDALSLDHGFFEREVESLLLLEWHEEVAARDSPHGAHPILDVNVPSVSMEGRIILEDVRARTYAREGVQRRVGVAAPGLVGLTLLRPWIVDLDFLHHTVTLWKRA